MYLGHLQCCGVREIASLMDSRSAEAALKEFCAQIEPVKEYWSDDLRARDRFRYAIFTATSRSKYGKRFADYLISHNLGAVINTEWNVNPNSGNKVKVWVWTVDHKALKEWKTAHVRQPVVVLPEVNNGQGVPAVEIQAAP